MLTVQLIRTEQLSGYLQRKSHFLSSISRSTLTETLSFRQLTIRQDGMMAQQIITTVQDVFWDMKYRFWMVKHGRQPLQVHLRMDRMKSRQL